MATFNLGEITCKAVRRGELVNRQVLRHVLGSAVTNPWVVIPEKDHWYEF